ncbi:MAG: recombinase RecT [Geminicoccaceae bacterium]
MTDNGKLIVQDDAVALFDTAKFEHMQRVATLMASSDLVPTHLQNKVANCTLIVQQALRWQMDPFALAQGTFVVGNKLGYEGKVVAAVANTRANLKERLKFDVSGSGQQCSVVVRGTFKGEDEERTVEATWVEGNALSKSGAKWKELPDQQLCYYAARKWTRRHCPELILGVLSDDEVQAMARHVGPDYAKDITPQGKPIASLDALADKLEEKPAQEPDEMHQEAGDDIVDTDTGEITEASPEQPQAQHGMAHEQEGFDLGPVAIQIDLVRKGPKPTFQSADDAYKALCDRLVELDAIPGVMDLEKRNQGFTSTLPPPLIEDWQNAVDDKLLDLKERAA